MRFVNRQGAEISEEGRNDVGAVVASPEGLGRLLLCAAREFLQYRGGGVGLGFLEIRPSATTANVEARSQTSYQSPMMVNFTGFPFVEFEGPGIQSRGPG